jgi:hypothetical protein
MLSFLFFIILHIEYIQLYKRKMIDNLNIEEEGFYLEAEADSSSSQWRMCLTLRLNTAADCLTSLLSSRITALTPATVSMKFVKAIWLCFWVRAEEKKIAQKRERYLYLLLLLFFDFFQALFLSIC